MVPKSPESEDYYADIRGCLYALSCVEGMEKSGCPGS